MYPGSGASRSIAAHGWPAIVFAWLLASLSAGCGGSDGLSPGDGGNGPGGGDGGGKNLQLFIGTWHVASGIETLNCAGQTDTSAVTDTIWQMGTTSDLLQPPDSTDCPLLANVSGNTATAVPNQSCSETMSGSTLTLTLTSYTFTVAASGTTATDNGSGAALVTGAISTSCTLTENATYTKAP